MFTLRRDFGMFGRLFGVPRAWLSRVGAFCSSWCPEGGLVTLKIPDFPDPTKNPIKVGIDEDELKKFVQKNQKDVEVPSTEVGTPSTVGSFTLDDKMHPKTFSWTRGANGLNLHVLVEGREDGGTHQVYDAVLQFSKDGLLISVSGGTGGMNILG